MNLNSKKICMIVQNRMVKGGISAVTNGYHKSKLEKDYDIIYIESYKDGNKFTKLIKAICGYMHFVKVLVFDKPDIIHIHSSFGPSFYRKIPFIYAASLFKKPIINHIHGADFDSFYTNAKHIKKVLVKKVYNKCSILIALSAEWKQTFSQIISEQKIIIIENYSILHKDALDERLKRKSNNTVLFMGEIGQRKGCYDIPKVLEKVVKKIPDVRFVLGGEGSDTDEANIKQLLINKGIMNYVEFPGWVRGDKKDKMLREADIFFLPSYNEGMPMSILEAMGYGLPIVSTNVGGISKVVHNGENGYYFKPGDYENFGEVICELLVDSDKYLDMSKKSFQIVYESYSLEVHIKKLEAVYKMF